MSMTDSKQSCTHWRVDFDGEKWKCKSCGQRFFSKDDMREAFKWGYLSELGATLTSEQERRAVFDNWFYETFERE
jgi:hypothetical protein